MSTDVPGGSGGIVRITNPAVFRYVARISVCPLARCLTNPVSFTLATLVFDETHCARPVTMSVDPSARVARAEQRCALNSGTHVTDTDAGGGAPPVTVRTVPPITLSKVALISVEPGETCVTRPAELTVATFVFEDVHAAELVTSRLVALVSVAIALH
jgi:hypothetical protein